MQSSITFVQQLFIPLILPAMITFVSIRSFFPTQSITHWSQYGLLFLLLTLGLQLFLLPWTPLTFTQGKLTSLTPSHIPSLYYTFVMFALFPILFSKSILSQHTLDQQQSIKYQLITLTIGFFVATLFVQIIQPLDIMLALIAFTMVYHSNLLPPPNASSSSMLLSTWNILVFLLVLSVIVTSFKFIPKYNDVSMFVSEYVGISHSSLFQHTQLVALFCLLPLLLVYSLRKWQPSSQDISIIYSIGVMAGMFIQTRLQHQTQQV